MRALILTAIIALVLPAAIVHANDCRGGAPAVHWPDRKRNVRSAAPRRPVPSSKSAANRNYRRELFDPAIRPSRFAATPAVKSRLARVRIQSRSSKTRRHHIEAAVPRKKDRVRHIPIIALFASLAAEPALARDFLCSELTQVGRATTGELVPVAVREGSQLKITIDIARPTRSSITWINTGDPELDDQANRFTPGSRVIERGGQIIASLMADSKFLQSAGTLLIGRTGDLWITESTAASDKIAHYIIQGRCERK